MRICYVGALASRKRCKTREDQPSDSREQKLSVENESAEVKIDPGPQAQFVRPVSGMLDLQ